MKQLFQSHLKTSISSNSEWLQEFGAIIGSLEILAYTSSTVTEPNECNALENHRKESIYPQYFSYRKCGHFNRKYKNSQRIILKTDLRTIVNYFVGKPAEGSIKNAIIVEKRKQVK